jgi:hypothetical protein
MRNVARTTRRLAGAVTPKAVRNTVAKRSRPPESSFQSGPAHSTQRALALKQLSQRVSGAELVAARLQTSPSEDQARFLNGLVAAAAERTAQRANNPALPPLGIIVDKDHCAAAPIFRTLAAAMTAADDHGVPMLREAATLSVLPGGKSSAGFLEFVKRSGLADAHPEMSERDWERVRLTYQDAFEGGRHEYIDAELLKTDRLAPGAADFLNDFIASGGEVHIVTALPDNLREVTSALFISEGVDGIQLSMKPVGSTQPDAEYKAARVRALDCEVVAVFDDLQANRQAMGALCPNAVQVTVAHGGFANEEPPQEGWSSERAIQISSFLR